ncbi:MAG: hypothetical protein M1837_001799 [Sclerophora amabilis]|nr:MAG: hypothetical protein M1837_001799 [Sclerophora amabilis]
MIKVDSSWIRHVLQNASLILLSIIFLPLDTSILVLSYGVRIIRSKDVARDQIRASPTFCPRTILVTGVGMSKGLSLARAFYEAGHHVIGADCEPNGVPVNGRFSRALLRFYPLTRPGGEGGATSYVQDLLSIVRKEKVDLWVSCSGVASAAEDGQAKEEIESQTACMAIQFDVKLTTTLHEKHSFIEYTASIGLNTPETHHVSSRASAHKVLNNAIEKRYIMKNVGVDDASRGDMTFLPRPTLSETYHHLLSMDISPQNPWVLQQYIRGKEYCTHALVVRGEVRAFVACPSSELLMYYEALPSQSALSQAMLEYTQQYAARSPNRMTGHLSFDFLVEEKVKEQGTEKVLYPIECNPRAHTAVVLFGGTDHAMARAYLSSLGSETTESSNGNMNQVVTPEKDDRYYWIGHDLITLVLHPTIRLLSQSIGLIDFIRSCVAFVDHVFFWNDGTFEFWDPLPWWWLYHVYWPWQFLISVRQDRRWSRINVSTTKMFLC